MSVSHMSIPRLDEVRIDTPVLFVTTGLTVSCALLCALLPAWRAARVDPGDTLKAGAHTVTDRERGAGLRTLLVGAEVALTTTLLVLGGLLVASFVNVLRVDRGFSTAHVLAADLELPLEGDATVDSMIPEGDTRPVAAQPIGAHLQVSAGYFDVVGLPLVRGRATERAGRAARPRRIARPRLAAGRGPGAAARRRRPGRGIGTRRRLGRGGRVAALRGLAGPTARRDGGRGDGGDRRRARLRGAGDSGRAHTARRGAPAVVESTAGLRPNRAPRARRALASSLRSGAGSQG